MPNEFAVDPEMERIWREDEEPSFTEIRNSIPEEEEVVEDLEQPEDTADTEDSEIDETEIVEDTPEEESVEDQPTEEDDKKLDTEVETTPESYKVKANGQEFDLSLDELKQLAPKALDYTKKLQELAPWRKSISALKENGFGENDINFAIDLLKGDKQAIAEVLKRTGIDALDIDTDSKTMYEPKQYGKDESALAIEEIVNRIGNDTEYAITERVVDQEWDSRSRQTMGQNPQMIEALHNDIKDGTYNKVSPLATKLKALDGGRLSDLEYYMEAGKQYFNSKPVEVVQENTRQKDIQEMSNKRKAATPSKSNSGKRDVINYLDESDESFDEWYKNLQARQ